MTNTESGKGIYPLVIAKKDNNGVGKFIDSGKLKFKGNKIVMIKTGDGGAGLSYYHSDDFFATTSVMILEENKEKFNWQLKENIGLFLITTMKKYKNIFSHSNGVNEEKFNNLTIFLPSKNGEPDWKYMDKFIEDRKKAMKIDFTPPPPTNLNKIKLIINKIKNCEKTELLEKIEWKEFVIENIFDCRTTKPIIHIKNGKYNYVTRSSINNGVSNFVDNENYELNKSNCITIGAEGAIAFYQDKDFVAGVKVYTLRNENITENNGLFLCVMLNKNSVNYSYSNARILDKIKVSY